MMRGVRHASPRRSVALGLVFAASLALFGPGLASAEEVYTRSKDLQAFAERELERSGGSGRRLGLRLSRMGFTCGVARNTILCARVVCGGDRVYQKISYGIRIRFDAVELATAINYPQPCPDPQTREKGQRGLVFRAPRIKPLEE